MRYIYKTKNSKDYNVIELGIFYEIGGYSYFTGDKKPQWIRYNNVNDES